jgi:hypothetical protein
MINEELEHITDIQERQTSLLLNLANSYFELLGEVGGLKHTIQMQGKLLNSCMERIMSLEGRAKLANFNGRIEQLELWLYTHDYAYFQQQENGQNWQQEMEEENKSGNSSFEDAEMHRMMGGYYNGYVPEDTTGTHPPNCRCPYCEPQEGVIEHYAG